MRADGMLVGDPFDSAQEEQRSAVGGGDRNAYDVLVERGFVHLVSDPEGLRAALEQPITLYCGYDPTAPSLTVGHLVPIMAMMHLQRHGHRVIALVGGGTGRVGDPTGKIEARPLLDPRQITANAQALRRQLERYLDFEGGRALLVNNEDWLLELRHIDFLRDVGRHFSVNEMLASEPYRTRLETTGLSYMELGYRPLQAYDFLHLFRTYGCVLQIGGADQWPNILAGVDLIRRAEGARAYGMVTPLLTTAAGTKMGKTEAGAVWLDEARTSPYEYYQFWINTDDADVERFLALFTFLPMDRVHALGQLHGSDLREAKEILAFEATKIAHGEAAARAAQATSRALFSPTAADEEILEAVPSTSIEAERLRAGIPAAELLAEVGLCRSRSEARRLIGQGGAYLNNRRIEGIDVVITLDHAIDGHILLRAGKKRYHRIVVREE